MRRPRPGTAWEKILKVLAEKGAMRPGDILVFDTNRGRTGLHTALYTGNGRFVHSPTSGKRVREDSLAQEYWKKRLIRIRRIVR